MKQFTDERKEELSEYHKLWQQNHPEKLKVYRVRYYSKNKEKINERHRQYYLENKDKIDFKHKEYNDSHKEELKARNLQIKMIVLSHYSNDTLKCACCGENHIEFLTIDHKDNNGAEHRREIGNGGNALYRWLIENNFPEGFQVLCWNCNVCKGHLEECYHKNPDIFYKDRGASVKFKVITHYSNSTNKCICCGEDIIFFLSIDHINGGGYKHRKKIKRKSGWPFYQWLINNNYPEGYRVLCHNCNGSLGTNHYCSHHPEGVPVPEIKLANLDRDIIEYLA